MKITLKQARVGKDLSQKEVSIALGVGQTTISNWEDKPSTVPAVKAFALAELYGVEITDLIFEP